MTRPKILLDCDPGADDTMAILCAAAYGELVGITTVNGNVSLDKTTHNALIVTQIADIDVPVRSGADRPLIADPVWADDVHGASGLDGPTLPPLTRSIVGTDAIEYLIETTRAHDDLWLVPTGPLTNIALAIRADPQIVHRVQGIVLMGGSTTVGNITASAEFNVFADPEAAAIVFASGGPITMIGLNLTHQVRMNAAHAAQLRASGSPTGILIGDLLDFYSGRVSELEAADGAAIHDPCAILAVTHPELFTFANRHVVVETAGTHTRGMTLVDERGSPDQDPNVRVAYGIDAARAIELISAAATG